MQASFVQTNFLGGAWSPDTQARTDLEGYKTALKQCTNAFPRINGAWTRRPGFQFMAHTRRGQKGRLIGLEFSYQSPFQIELTNGFMRAYLGQALVLTSDNNVTVSSISTANPAVVTVKGALPSGWANGDTIVFDFAQAMSTPILSGRQFTIAGISGATFQLYDALTGKAVDGTSLAYTAPSPGIDYIYKVSEWVMPYSSTELDDVRIVMNGTTGLLLHAKHQPRAITHGSTGLSVAAQSFTDGPYLDINTTATTLTPGAASGSTTLTASSTTGINNGYGFLSTDIGRLVRFQSAPAAYASGTTYAKDALVLGSDNNIYQSVAGSNIGHDPTTDDGTHWVLTGQTVTWSWFKITAWTSATVVTATVMGDTLPSLAASTSWQLGLWSDTTGWPTCGTWFQGRLWLGSKSIANRFDGSVSNDDFNFAPSAADGTVGDASAIAAPYNTPDASQLYWMLPVQAGGIVLGTNSGEWLVRASALGDPITPTSIQVSRVSTYGCANMDPVAAQLTTVFVQRERRKVMDYANYPFGEATGWFAADTTLYSDDKTTSGVAELRYQQEPSKLLWARRTDGTLVGSVFQHAPYGKESYNGWHDHPIGGNRTVVSISSGPSFDGLSTTLFAVLDNATTGYYECVALTPLFEIGSSIWSMTFTDGVASPSASRVMQTANGDSFDGLRIYGLYDVAGQTVTPQIGGYDLGDFTVNAAGYVDVPFTTTFTKAIVDAFNTGTDYGTFALPVSEANVGTYTTPAIGAYYGETTNLTDVQNNSVFLDRVKNIAIMNQLDGLRVYNPLTFVQLRDATFAQIVGPGSTYTAFEANGLGIYHPATGCFYAHVGGGNMSPIMQVDIGTLKTVAIYGTTSSSFAGSSPAGIQTAFNSMIALSYAGTNYIAQVGIKSTNLDNEICLLNADPLEFLAADTISEAQAFLCAGADNSGVFYALGTITYGSPATTPFSLYKCQIGDQAGNFGFTQTKIGSVAPTAIDATWTNFADVFGLAYDPTDGNLIGYCYTLDAVTHKYYIFKIKAADATVVWATAITPSLGALVDWSQARPKNGKFVWFTNNNWQSVDTATGALTTTAFGSGGVIDTANNNQLYWPEMNAIIASTTVAGLNSDTVVKLGTYAQSNNSWSTVWSYLALSGPTSNTFALPATIGVNYTTYGQLLKPDFGQEAGARNGPAFGKIRRHHWYGVTVVNSAAFDLAVADSEANVVDWTSISMYAYDETVSTGTTLFTGTISDTIDDDYSFDASLVWRVTRPTPLTITAIGGYLATQDK